MDFAWLWCFGFELIKLFQILTYVCFIYFIASVTEWVIHRYMMHSPFIFPYPCSSQHQRLLLKTNFGGLHKHHHASVLRIRISNTLNPKLDTLQQIQEWMCVSSNATLDALIFNWNFTVAVFFSTWFLTFTGWSICFSSILTIECHTTMVAFFAIGFTLIWNTIHPDMHSHAFKESLNYPWWVVCPSLFVYFPNVKPFVRRLFYLHYRHHCIHHLYSSWNYNVVFLGADILFGTQKWCIYKDKK
jgi:hypothetical protein